MRTNCGEKMTKYADSFRYVFSVTTTGATAYSGWFDVSWANEIYSWLTFSETGTASSETIDVTLERYVPQVTPTASTVITHTQATAATTEEKYAHCQAYDGGAPGAENKLGGRVRWKCVSGGTFGSGNTITVTMRLDAFRR